MLWAVNFYEISGPVIVRQTEELVTNSSPLAAAKASQRDAWFPRGRPSSGAVEIDEDGTYPGETNTPQRRGQALSPGDPLPRPADPERQRRALLPARPDSSNVSVEGKPFIMRGCHHATQGLDSVTCLICKVDGRAFPWQACSVLNPRFASALTAAGWGDAHPRPEARAHALPPAPSSQPGTPVPPPPLPLPASPLPLRPLPFRCCLEQGTRRPHLDEETPAGTWAVTP